MSFLPQILRRKSLAAASIRTYAQVLGIYSTKDKQVKIAHSDVLVFPVLSLCSVHGRTRIYCSSGIIQRRSLPKNFLPLYYISKEASFQFPLSIFICSCALVIASDNGLNIIWAEFKFAQMSRTFHALFFPKYFICK